MKKETPGECPPIRLKRLLAVLPLVLVLCTLVYFKCYERYYSDRFAGELFSQKVEQFDAGTLLYSALSLTDSSALAVLLSIVETTDGEPGIYARVLGPGLEILNRPRFNASYEDSLLEFLDPVHPFHSRARELIARDSTGEFRVEVRGKELRVHHWRFMIDGRPYHTVIGVVPDILGQIVNMNHFTLGLLVLCGCTLVSVYYTIYLVFTRKRE